MLGGTPVKARALWLGRSGMLALLVAGACQGSKFGSADEPVAGAGGAAGASGGKGGKGGGAGSSTGGRGGSAGRPATGGSGGDSASGGAPEGGEGNEPATGGGAGAGKGGAGGSAGKGGSGNGGSAGGGTTSGGAGSGGSAGSDGDACPAERPAAMAACPEEQLGAMCAFGDQLACICELRPELNSAPTWYCEGCPPDPVASYEACAPVDASCTYDEMTCSCLADGNGGTWRCMGCPPELPLTGSCFPEGFPPNGCPYGNTLCSCSQGGGFHCAGGCQLEWFSFTEISMTDHTHPPWSEAQLIELVGKINLGNNFVYNLPASTDAATLHSHQVPFNATNLWLLQSGLAEVEIATGLGDGHHWLVECMP